MPSKNVAIFRVSGELIREVFRLPEGTVVTGLSNNVFFYTDEWAIRCEHPDLPLTVEGAAITTINPQYERGSDGKAVFVGWGITSKTEAADQKEPTILRANALREEIDSRLKSLGVTVFLSTAATYTLARFRNKDGVNVKEITFKTNLLDVESDNLATFLCKDFLRTVEAADVQ